MASLVDFKVGLRVRVMNRTFSGKEIVEGYATIKEITQGDRQGVHAVVEFDDDPGQTFERWVFASYQDDALDCSNYGTVKHRK